MSDRSDRELNPQPIQHEHDNWGIEFLMPARQSGRDSCLRHRARNWLRRVGYRPRLFVEPRPRECETGRLASVWSAARPARP